MKFHKTLEKGQVNAWKDFYIPYNHLKQIIKNDKDNFKREIYRSFTKIDGFYLKVEGLIMEEKNKINKRIIKKTIEKGEGKNCVEKGKRENNDKFIDKNDHKESDKSNYVDGMHRKEFNNGDDYESGKNYDNKKGSKNNYADVNIENKNKHSDDKCLEKNDNKEVHKNSHVDESCEEEIIDSDDDLLSESNEEHYNNQTIGCVEDDEKLGNDYIEREQKNDWVKSDVEKGSFCENKSIKIDKEPRKLSDKIDNETEILKSDTFTDMDTSKRGDEINNTLYDAVDSKLDNCININPSRCDFLDNTRLENHLEISAKIKDNMVVINNDISTGSGNNIRTTRGVHVKDSHSKSDLLDTEKKGDKKLPYRSFDDNCITKERSKKKKYKFNVLDVFKLKDKYSQRQQERNITKLIEVCESMKSFSRLNFTGFRKIIKKYDKCYLENMTEVLLPEVKSCYFYKSKRIEHIIDDLKNIYRTHFAPNDKRKAKNVFENIAKREKPSQLLSFFSGSFLSVSIFIFYNIEFAKETFKYKNLFVGINMILYGFLLFGLCMVMFKKHYINFGFIFDFDIATQESISTYFFIVSIFCLVHNLGFFLTLKYGTLNPLYVIFTNLIILIFPFKLFYRDSRYFFLFALCKMFMTPLFTVQFRHFYIADCLQSFSFAYKLMFLYFCKNSKSNILLIICIIPCYIRIAQCFRRSREEKMMKIQLLNALKYFFTTLFIISCFVYTRYSNMYFLICKFTLGLTSSFYSLYWDLIIDWEIKRKNRIYNKGFPIFICIYNLISRFTWIITHEIVSFELVASIMEIHRRFLWTLLRVECEHLNNRDNLKAICGFTVKLSDMFYKVDDEVESAISEDEKMDESVI